MFRLRVFWLGLAGCSVGAAAVLALAAWAWLPSQQEAAVRLQRAFAERTGTEIDLGSVRWTLWPVPTLVVEDAVTRQANPIVARRIRLQGSWRSLLHRAPRVAEAELEGLVLSRAALAELAGAHRSPPDGAAPLARARILRAMRVAFRDLTWVDRRHVEVVYDGVLDFAADGLPARAEVSRAGAEPPARLGLARQGQALRWAVDIQVAGGSWNGSAGLQDEPGAKGGRLRLQASLAPRGIDVAALAGTFRRHSVVAGRAGGATALDARGEHWIDLLHGLRTRTDFVVQPARLTGFDLGRAIASAGTETAGQTPLEQLAGVVETRNTGAGVEFRYSNLKAHSGALSASGNLKVLGGRLDGELAVDIVDGVVGVPVRIAGTVTEPVITPSAGALTGAAVGSAVLPGVGTALGARLGHQVERLLGGDGAAAGTAGAKPGRKAGKAGKAGEAAPPRPRTMGEPPNAERGPAR